MNPRVLILLSGEYADVLHSQGIIVSILRNLAEIIEKKGFEVTFNGHEPKEWKSAKPSQVTLVPQSRFKFIKRLIPQRLWMLLRELKILSQANKHQRELSTLPKPDYIIELLSLGSRTGADLSQKWGIPLILIYDSPIRLQFKEMTGFSLILEGIFKKREKQSLLAADEVIVYSDAVAEHVDKLAGQPVANQRFHIIDYSKLTFQESREFNHVPTIGFIGSFLHWHRVDLLVDAFIRLKAEGYQARLCLVGDGAEWPKVHKKLEDAGLLGEVELPGFVRDPAVLATYKAKMDIGVMPSSNWYGAPTKIFEYGAARMAAIGPETPTISFIFEKDKHLLQFENHDLEGLYLCLKKLLDEPEQIPVLADNLHRYIRTNYSDEFTGEFYSRMLKSEFS